MTCNWEDRFPTYWNIMNQFGSFFNTYPPLKHEVRSWKMLEFRVLVDVSSCGASKLMSFLGMVGIPFSAGRNHWVVGYVSVVKHWPRWPEASQMCKSTFCSLNTWSIGPSEAIHDKQSKVYTSMISFSSKLPGLSLHGGYTWKHG